MNEQRRCAALRLFERLHGCLMDKRLAGLLDEPVGRTEDVQIEFGTTAWKSALAERL